MSERTRTEGASKSARMKESNRNGFVKAYLMFYNMALTLGWMLLAVQTLAHFLENGSSTKGLYKRTVKPLKIFQTAAVLEVVHCVVGFVSSSAILTAAQVYSRVFLVWAILVSVPDVQTSVGLPLCLFAWSITEVIRYSFYWLTLLESLPYVIQWCRYTFFIVLYPIGVLGELIIAISALPFIQKNKLYTIEMPNSANVSFSFYIYVILHCVLYIPVFPRLYGHMLKQRKKVIGGQPRKED